MATLDDIRKKLQALENRKNQNTGPSLTYPFWNMQEGSTAVVRFLPDGNEDNTFFWKERQLLNLPFPGIKGHDENKSVYVRVPCVEMWGETCPVLAQVRPMWNDKELEETARTYWKKRSYLFQGFVLEDPLEASESPENPIRRFTFGPQIFNIIKDALLDPDMEHIPVDYVNGTDFRISVTRKGKYRDYTTSKWSRKESALEPEHLEAIEKYGLFNLNDWMPAKPNANALRVIEEMFEASINGELYDPERWAQYYRPYGFEFEGVTETSDDDVDSDSDDTSTSSKKVEPKVVEKQEPEKVTASPKTDGKSVAAQDILKKIRERANS